MKTIIETTVCRMSDMLPLAMYALNVEPYTHTPAVLLDTPVTVRITMAAIDPEPFDEDNKPSTLRIIRRNPVYLDAGEVDEEKLIEELEGDEAAEDGDEASDDDKEEEDEDEDVDEDDEDEDEDDDGEDEYEECVVVTLSPETRCQQAIDITIAPEEDVQFLVTGSYTISLTGNYVKHPFDEPLEDLYSDEDSEEYSDDELDQEIEEDDELDHDEASSEESDEDQEFYDAISEGDEDIDEQLAKLEETSDVEAHLEDLIAKDNKKKRKQEQLDEQPETKKSKKTKDEKNTKATEIEKKNKAQVLEGGVIIEDRKIGEGPKAKKGSKVGMRYIGKLKNGKVFDKNTSGKPFYFKLHRGEVIKGWDIGVTGMAIGGERRIVIPAPYAYGKQTLPGIPANSELTFDVKLVSLK